jgi:hypothetical protein
MFRFVLTFSDTLQLTQSSTTFNSGWSINKLAAPAIVGVGAYGMFVPGSVAVTNSQPRAA